MEELYVFGKKTKSVGKKKTAKKVSKASKNSKKNKTSTKVKSNKSKSKTDKSDEQLDAKEILQDIIVEVVGDDKPSLLIDPDKIVTNNVISNKSGIEDILFKLPMVENPLIGTPKQVQRDLDGMAKRLQHTDQKTKLHERNEEGDQIFKRRA